MSTNPPRLPLPAHIPQALRDCFAAQQAAFQQQRNPSLAERRADFHALAHQRYARFLESGQSVPWEEVREYLKARLAGAASKRPRPRKLDR